jgi:serine/threonine protein kinase
MLASVRSAYVANLLDVNEEHGVHFLALEFVRGKSLKAFLDERRRLDEPLALSLTADVCRALSEAHARGIVHRDIKPENVLLMEDAESKSPRVKLTDFGLARQIQQSESLDMTRESVVGTPLYMAPEQGSGGGTIDARTDIYSLGATLFHLLAGEPPFSGDTPMEVLYKHANEPVPKMPSTSGGVSRVIERALAKSPAERFPDAAAMLAELERLLRGEPSSLAIHHAPTRAASLPTNSAGNVARRRSSFGHTCRTRSG